MVEPPRETCLGNRSPFPMCLQTLSEEKERCLFQLFMAVPLMSIVIALFPPKNPWVREKEHRARESHTVNVSAGNQWSLRGVTGGGESGVLDI